MYTILAQWQAQESTSWALTFRNPYQLLKSISILPRHPVYNLRRLHTAVHPPTHSHTHNLRWRCLLLQKKSLCQSGTIYYLSLELCQHWDMTVKPVLNQYNIYIAQHIKLETLTCGIKPHFRRGQRSPLLCVWKQLFTGPYDITIVCTLFQGGRQKQDRHLFWGIFNIQFGSILLCYPERHKPP